MIFNGRFNSYSASLTQMLTKLRKRQVSTNNSTDAGLEESSGCEDKDSGQMRGCVDMRVVIINLGE